jgi:hypothetical protein
VWSNDLDRYAGRSVTAVKDSHGRQVKVDTPDTKGFPGWSFSLTQLGKKA